MAFSLLCSRIKEKCHRLRPYMSNMDRNGVVFKRTAGTVG